VPRGHDELIGRDGGCVEKVVNKLAALAPDADVATPGLHRVHCEPANQDLVISGSPCGYEEDERPERRCMHPPPLREQKELDRAAV
jgi:hypothetical protein